MTHPAGSHWQAKAVVLACMLVFAGGPIRAASVSDGLLVEAVQPHFAGDRAGLEPGDVLMRWSSSDDGGSAQAQRLLTLFDLAEVERERHPGTPVTVHGMRDDQAFSFALGPGEWRVQVRPRLDAVSDARYTEVLQQFESDGDSSRIEAAADFAQALGSDAGALHAAWVLFNVAQTAEKRGELPAASRLYTLAIEGLDASANPNAVAFLQHNLGLTYIFLGRFDDARSAYANALEIEESIAPQRMGVAANTVRLGSVEIFRGNFDAARQYVEQGLWLQERLAPDSLPIVGTLSELGRLYSTQGDLTQGAHFYRRALEIAEAEVPGGVLVAKHLSNLGVNVRLQGDQAGAEALYQRALRLISVLEPESRTMSALLNNIGTIKEDRGELRLAEDYFLRSLAIDERIQPHSGSVALKLDNLGVVAMERGDFVGAHDYHKRAYARTEASAPDSMLAAIMLTHLGDAARHLQDYDGAQAYLRDAMRITERRAPASEEHARILLSLGVLQALREKPARAAEYFQSAQEAFALHAPAGRGVAETSMKLGDIGFDQGELMDAQRKYARALSIFEVIAPATYKEAAALYGLARVHRARDETSQARAMFERATRALDAQHGRLGGTSETKANSRAQYLGIYTDYIELLLASGDRDAAFNVLERSRSKVLSDLLAERELVFSVDLPADLERDRRVLAQRYERLQAELYDAANPESVDKLQEPLREVRRRQEQLQQRIAELAPRLADLQYPAPISLDNVRSVLNPGTAVLSYAVGDNDTHMFVLAGNADLTVRTLPLGRSELNELVTRFRHLIDAGRYDRNAQNSLLELGVDLYQRLIVPAGRAIDSADSLLIVPDAALNLLPFAALVMSTADDGPRYLAQWKPTYLVSSLTVYGQLKKARERTTQGALIAFGDPAYLGAVEAAGDPATIERRLDDGRRLTALPWSGTEVRNIAEIYRDSANVYTGADATEARAKAIPRDARYVHFASHALLNESRPMDTAIVLASPKQPSPDDENGFLQAWEVYESLRLDADLVTLSACQTALGTDYPGEGLIGLTRAFQYAGASSVIASLWNVNDRSTSQLMRQFYANLKSGMTPAVALSSAQVALIDGATVAHDRSGGWRQTLRRWFTGAPAADNYSHPYHWAGFVLNGPGG